jgi:hypothetical protein
MATTYYNQIQQLYVAYFNRPADPGGLAYWEGVMEASKNTDATQKAITAQFSQEAEYKSAFAGMNNGQIIDKIYSNLFGRAPDAEGRAYWVGLMDSNKVTVDRAVADIAAAAKNQDLVTIQSKVAASVAFTAALDTPAEQAGYNTASTGPAKTFLAGVTDAATLAAAIAPATLGATVAKVVAAGTTFSLASGLDALSVATAAKDAFLDAADGKVDGKFGTGTDAAAKLAAEAKIGTDTSTAVTNLDALVTGDYTNSSTGVRAALLSSQQALNAASLADAQTALNTANANIAKVAGLSAAVAVLESAKTAVTNANTADKAAMVDLAAKLAAYNAQNTVQVTVAADGTVAGLIEINATTKALQLVSGVTETKNPGVTALLASSTALEAADAAVTSANTAQTNAQKAVDVLDLTPAAKDDLKAIGSAMTYVKLETGATATTAQINTELGQLDAVQKSTAAIAAQTDATQAQKDAAAAAKTAYDTFKALVDKMATDDNANPLLKAQSDASAVVTAATKQVTDLQKAVDAVATANATAAQLAAVNGQVKAANDAFTDHSLVTPVTLDADHVANVATAGADIYVAGKVDASILNFALLGSDSLYVGNSYTLNTGDYTKGAGNNSVLEAFIVKSGTDTKVVLEKSAFGSNAATPEIVTITLTGVDSTKVHLTNGIITVG